MVRRRTMTTRVSPALALATLAAAVAAWAGEQSASIGVLFPRPFVVEHHVRQTEPGGGVFESEPVTDYYGGSWIVSVRKDGGRTIVDLARREITQCNPKSGTYSTLSFDRLGELRRRLRAADSAGSSALTAAATSTRASAIPTPTPTFTFDESDTTDLALPAGELPRGSRGHLHRLDVTATSRPAGTAGTAHAASTRSATASLTVWVDDGVRLQPAALDAIARFESEALGGSDTDAPGPSRLLAAARERAGGAFPVRTQHSLRATSSGAASGQLEDIVTRLEYVDTLPAELVSVPEGFRRAAHPLEIMVAHAEAEAALRAGKPSGAARQARP